MSFGDHPLPRIPLASRLVTMLLAPTMVVFLSSNLVNVGNLAFNMLFSRWMGPELFGDLAFILTVKLALLGILGALQASTSQQIAATPKAEQGVVMAQFGALNRKLLVAGCGLLPVLIGVLLAFGLGTHSGLDNPNLLLLLLVSVPFIAPLSILRGVAFGRIATSKIVLTANVEMAVRLVGAIVAWHLGAGIEGVVLAIVLSIVAAWVVLLDLLPTAVRAPCDLRPVGRVLTLAAVPFAGLQLAQVFALDGDILLAKSALPENQAGYLAALSLFQRIQFFSCFALASVLLPSVVSAVREGRSAIRSAAPIAGVFVSVSVVFLALVQIAPDRLITLLVGNEFATAASGLWMAALASVAFTFNYLLATFLAALGDRRGIWLTLAIAAAQLGAMAVQVRQPDAVFLDLLGIKSGAQLVLAAILTATVVVRMLRSRGPKAVPPLS